MAMLRAVSVNEMHLHRTNTRLATGTPVCSNFKGDAVANSRFLAFGQFALGAMYEHVLRAIVSLYKSIAAISPPFEGAVVSARVAHFT
jgi:hypothetical protein